MCVYDPKDIVQYVRLCENKKGKKRQGMCERAPNNSVRWAKNALTTVWFLSRTDAHTEACCDRLHWKFFQGFADTLTVYQLDRQIPECFGKHANAPPRILQAAIWKVKMWEHWIDRWKHLPLANQSFYPHWSSQSSSNLYLEYNICPTSVQSSLTITVVVLMYGACWSNTLWENVEMCAVWLWCRRDIREKVRKKVALPPNWNPHQECASSHIKPCNRCACCKRSQSDQSGAIG